MDDTVLPRVTRPSLCGFLPSRVRSKDTFTRPKMTAKITVYTLLSALALLHHSLADTKPLTPSAIRGLNPSGSSWFFFGPPPSLIKYHRDAECLR